MGLPGASRERLVTVLPGHGIGPELVNAAMACIKATNAPVSFEVVDDIKDRLTPTALASARKTGTILKGEFVTGVGRGTLPSINVDLRKSLSLFANVVHSFNLPGIPSRHDGVDIVIVRENLEGEFSGMEHEVVPGVTESLKVMTAAGTPIPQLGNLGGDAEGASSCAKSTVATPNPTTITSATSFPAEGRE